MTPDRTSRATYLVRLAPFVTWPPPSFAKVDATLTICIVGEDPFGSALDDAARGQKAGTHPIIVRRLPDLTPETDCQIVYARDVVGSPLRIFASVAGQPVLTVAEDGPGPDGAMIHFTASADRVRFSIDLDPVEASGLTVSSKLLDLAVAVRKSAR